MFTIKMTFTLNIQYKDVATVLNKAFDGTSHWCDNIREYGQRLGGCLSDHIYVHNGKLMFHDKADTAEYKLTRHNLLLGIRRYVEMPANKNILTESKNDHNFFIMEDQITEDIVDKIIQLALFGAIRYKKEGKDDE